MEDIDYKELDRKAILDYLKRKGGEVEVTDIMAESGAEKLRVYSLLWELEHNRTILVTREGRMGAPEAVRLIEGGDAA